MTNNKTKVQNRSTKNDPIIQEIPLACADEKAAVEFMESNVGEILLAARVVVAPTFTR